MKKFTYRVVNAFVNNNNNNNNNNKEKEEEEEEEGHTPVSYTHLTLPTIYSV